MAVEPDFFEILEILNRHGVRFIVCGGIAAVLHGAPIMTADLDVVYETSPENCAKLLAALHDLEAVYFDVAGRRILPDLEKLASLKVHLLRTNRGRLDVLREIGVELDWAALNHRSSLVEVGEIPLRLLDLEAIIESKEAANRPKDRASLPFLKTLLEMKDDDQPS